LPPRMGRVSRVRYWPACAGVVTLVRLDLAPVPVAVRDEPLVQCAELSARDLTRDFRMRLDGGCIELGAENVADGVALEAAADATGKPVDVLEAAVTIVVRSDAEIGCDAGAPRFWQVFHL